MVRKKGFKSFGRLYLTLVLLMTAAPATGWVTDVATVSAQEDVGESGRASAFRSVEGADAEEVPGGALMIGAYAVMWLFLFFYLFRMQRGQLAVQHEIERLGRVLEDKGSNDSES